MYPSPNMIKVNQSKENDWVLACIEVKSLQGFEG